MIDQLFLLMTIKLVVIFIVLVALIIMAVWYDRTGGEWKYQCVIVLAVLNTLMALTGCDAPINPVKYQTVEVLVTRPCFSGRTPPAPAAQLTEPVCAGSDAECVRAAKADILELQREAREFRNLFKECSR